VQSAVVGQRLAAVGIATESMAFIGVMCKLVPDSVFGFEFVTIASSCIQNQKY